MKKMPIPPLNEEMAEDHLTMPENQFNRVHHYWDFYEQENYPLYPAGVEDASRRNPTWYKDLHPRYHMIVTVPEGELVYYAEGERFLLKKNYALIIPQGQAFHFESSRNPSYRKLSLFLLGVNASAIMETFNLNKMELIPVPDIDKITAAIQEIDKLIIRHNEEDLPKLSGMLMEILGQLSLAKSPPEENRILLRSACAKLSCNFDENIDIAKMAEELRISKRTLNRIFQENLGISPSKYRLDCRLNYARKLLKYSTFSIKEIAAKLGYCNQFYFSNEFVRNIGISPRRYRQDTPDINTKKGAE